jgi:hypothetical protein
MVTLVVFSMDRALQLDSLLHSIADHVTGVEHVVVIARASSELHQRAYDQLEACSSQLVTIVREDSATRPGVPLGAALAAAIERFDSITHVGFAVDDMIFYRPSDYAVAAKVLDMRKGSVWSWRLGHREPAHIDFQFDHTLHEMWWSCPSITDDRDYRYLFHTDGALYRRERLVTTLDVGMHGMPGWRDISFTPNAMESYCASWVSVHRAGLGPHLGPIAPTCITWQLNKESTTKGKYGAPWCEIPETNLDAMAAAYLAGKRVDNAALYADTGWTTRFNPPGARSTHVHACEEASNFYARLIR